MVAGGNGAEHTGKGQAGGGGSGGCGIVLIYAKIIAGTGTIRANGGDGGNGGQVEMEQMVMVLKSLHKVLIGSGFCAAAFNFTPGPTAGGTGSSSAVTRIDVIDPHIVQMVRDVMDVATLRQIKT